MGNIVKTLRSRGGGGQICKVNTEVFPAIMEGSVGTTSYKGYASHWRRCSG